MTCPRCGKPMGEILSQGVLIDFCTGCKGAWLDRGEARWFAADPAAVESALEGDLLDPHPSKMRCPRCASAMTEGGLFDARYLLDRCDGCFGVWFDGKELGRLKDAQLVSLDTESARASRPIGAFGGSAGVLAADGGVPMGALAGNGAAAALAMNPAAVLAAVPEVPNLVVRGTAVFLGFTAIVGLLFVTASTIGGLHPVLAVSGVLLVVALQYLLGPFILDFTLRWMNGMRWVEPSELPRPVVDFLRDACAKNGVRFPRLGMIDDGAPNAFTYGHHPNNARIVLTRGILDLLDEDEANAVVAHELGHVVHWDAVVMTLAACIPILCYGIYRAMVRIARTGKKHTQNAWIVALVAYVLYIAAEYVVLMLSRTREYYADRFSAEATGKPNALASALVKIAYGLVSNDAAAVSEKPERARAAGGAGAARAFGIFDPGAARNLAAASYAGGSFSRENLVGAMQWDLWNPWARWFEVHSTHPLPARRLQALAGEAVKRGQIPLIVFDKRQPESYWDEFAVDVFIKVLPLLVAAVLAPVAAFALGTASVPGAVVLGLGLGMLGKTLFTYHLDEKQGGYPSASVAALLKVVKVSPVRGVPATLRGVVIGRGNPGFVLSEDVVLQDKTGIVVLDYRAPLALISWWFALARVPELMGQEVIAKGWYRRGPGPYFELREIHCAGQTRRSWIYPMKLFFAGAAILVGVMLTFGGFLANL